MTLKCPCCGNAIEKFSLETLSEAALQPQEKTIVDTLAKAYPRKVSRFALVDALYGADPNGGPERPDVVLQVRISNLRKKLRPLGWNVSSAVDGPGSHAGYRLEPAA